MKVTMFNDLEIWKISIEVTLEVYRLSTNGKFSQDFGLRDQIRRAAVSISSNIAEGFEIHNNNDFIRFLRIAKGSTGEVRNQLYIAHKLGYINGSEFKVTEEKLQILSSQIGRFIAYLLVKKSNKEFSTR